jgi:hypothetical protein
MSEFFTHAPLDLTKAEIRLLELAAPQSRLSQPSQLLQCKIQHFSFDDCPPYQAVSYTWGDSQPSETVEINGFPFLIRDNLASFLYTIQRDSSVLLWIDALCIDQSNLVERNHQVQLMARIFNTATGVLVWLGYAADDSGFVMDLLPLHKIHLHCIALEQQTLYKFSSYMPQDSLAIHRAEPLGFFSTIGPESHECIKGPKFEAGFGALCRRAYWRRIWIIQELMFATHITIMCGQARVKWDDFYAILGQSSSLPSHTEAIFAERRFWSFGSAWSPHTRELSHPLGVYAECEASDVRDKVFGLLGLVDAKASISVDYSNTPEELYFRVLHKVFESEHRFSSKKSLKKFGVNLCGSLRLPESVAKLGEKLIDDIAQQRGLELGDTDDSYGLAVRSDIATAADRA